MNFLRQDDQGYNVFDFNCPRCGTTGEVGIPKDKAGLVRHDCGVLINHYPGYEGIRRPRISVYIAGPIGCYGTRRAEEAGQS